jgi:predicted nucleic acid-binding protein
LIDRGVSLGRFAGGLMQDIADRRIEHLSAQLEGQRARIVIPTPVLAEVLVKSLNDAENVVQTLREASRIELAHFGAPAAIEAALMLNRHLPRKSERDKEWSKHRLKFDLQILAIAKVEGVVAIYTNDEGLLRRAKAEGLKAFSLRDLAAPEETNPALPMPLPKLAGPKRRKARDE